MKKRNHEVKHGLIVARIELYYETSKRQRYNIGDTFRDSEGRCVVVTSSSKRIVQITFPATPTERNAMLLSNRLVEGEGFTQAQLDGAKD